MMREEELEVTVAEVDVGRVEVPEVLVLVDVVVEETEDEVVLFFV